MKDIFWLIIKTTKLHTGLLKCKLNWEECYGGYTPDTKFFQEAFARSVQ